MAKKSNAQSRKAKLASLEKILETLSDETLATLIDFAEFLQKKYPAKARRRPQAVKRIARPEDESVIAAIKRLSRTYPMLDKKILFEQTSVAMSAHVMQDISPEDSIDRLETVFREAYDTFLVKRKK